MTDNGKYFARVCEQLAEISKTFALVNEKIACLDEVQTDLSGRMEEYKLNNNANISLLQERVFNNSPEEKDPYLWAAGFATRLEVLENLFSALDKKISPIEWADYQYLLRERNLIHERLNKLENMFDSNDSLINHNGEGIENIFEKVEQLEKLDEINSNFIQNLLNRVKALETSLPHKDSASTLSQQDGLKDCPFCGGIAAIGRDYIVCEECGARSGGPAETKFSAWNKRVK